MRFYFLNTQGGAANNVWCNCEIQDLELVRRLVLAGIGIAPINEITILKAPTKEKLEILGKPSHLNICDVIYLIKKDRKKPHSLVTKILDHFNA